MFHQLSIHVHNVRLSLDVHGFVQDPGCTKYKINPNHKISNLSERTGSFTDFPAAAARFHCKRELEVNPHLCLVFILESYQLNSSFQSIN